MGETEAVTPAGAETVKPTAELNPFKELTVIVELPVPPCCTVTELGDADKEKLGGGGGAETVTVIVVEWDNVPLVPMTVKVKGPRAVVGDTEIVSVDGDTGVAELGLKMAVTPVGNVDVFSDTDELNPLIDVTAIEDVPELPC